MCAWDAGFEAETVALVERTVAGDRAAWRALMVRVAPRIEEWAKGSRVLRRCRLANDDDARTVMVDVLERLAANEHANLKKFLARTPPDAPEDDLVAEVLRLGRLDEDEAASPPPGDSDRGTPLRAWLLGLVDFAARDHVRRRYGWGKGDELTKRGLHTDANRLDDAPEPSARPPMTDKLTMDSLVSEVRDYMATFPKDMQSALQLWLDDVDVADIAKQLALADANRAKALVRAGQARLRERFRGRTPLLFGGL